MSGHLELENNFTYHAPKTGQPDYIQQVDVRRFKAYAIDLGGGLWLTKDADPQYPSIRLFNSYSEAYMEARCVYGTVMIVHVSVESIGPAV